MKYMIAFLDRTYSSPLTLVKEFHTTYGQSVRHDPNMDVPEFAMRQVLIDEEFDELMIARSQDDFVEVVDALADMIYVIYGAGLTFGVNLDDVMNHGVVAETADYDLSLPSPQESIYSRRDYPTLESAWGWIETAHQAVKDAHGNRDVKRYAEALVVLIDAIYVLSYLLEVNLDHILEEVQASNMSKLDADGNPIYREDGKILKGPNFFAPDIAKVLRLQNESKELAKHGSSE